MAWAVESGQYQKATGKDHPLQAQEPELERCDDFWITAFWDLSTTRQFGMSIGPIPWDKAIDYAERMELDDGMVGLFVRVMREMDRAFLDWQRKESKRKVEADRPPKVKRPR